MPIERVRGYLSACLVVKLGLVRPLDRPRFCEELREVLDPVVFVQDDTDPREDFLEHLRLEIAESGEMPSEGLIGEMLFEYGLDDLPPLPPDLARLMPRVPDGRG